MRNLKAVLHNSLILVVITLTFCDGVLLGKNRAFTKDSHPMLASLFESVNSVNRKQETQAEFPNAGHSHVLTKGTTLPKINRGQIAPPAQSSVKLPKRNGNHDSASIININSMMCKYCQSIQYMFCIRTYCSNDLRNTASFSNTLPPTNNLKTNTNFGIGSDHQSLHNSLQLGRTRFLPNVRNNFEGGRVSTLNINHHQSVFPTKDRVRPLIESLVGNDQTISVNKPNPTIEWHIGRNQHTNLNTHLGAGSRTITPLISDVIVKPDIVSNNANIDGRKFNEAEIITGADPTTFDSSKISDQINNNHNSISTDLDMVNKLLTPPLLDNVVPNPLADRDVQIQQPVLDLQKPTEVQRTKPINTNWQHNSPNIGGSSVNTFLNNQDISPEFKTGISVEQQTDVNLSKTPIIDVNVNDNTFNQQPEMPVDNIPIVNTPAGLNQDFSTIPWDVSMNSPVIDESQPWFSQEVVPLTHPQDSNDMLERRFMNIPQARMPTNLFRNQGLSVVPGPLPSLQTTNSNVASIVSNASPVNEIPTSRDQTASLQGTEHISQTDANTHPVNGIPSQFRDQMLQTQGERQGFQTEMVSDVSGPQGIIQDVPTTTPILFTIQTLSPKRKAELGVFSGSLLRGLREKIRT